MWMNRTDTFRRKGIYYAWKHPQHCFQDIYSVSNSTYGNTYSNLKEFRRQNLNLPTTQYVFSAPRKSSVFLCNKPKAILTGLLFKWSLWRGVSNIFTCQILRLWGNCNSNESLIAQKHLPTLSHLFFLDFSALFSRGLLLFALPIILM